MKVIVGKIMVWVIYILLFIILAKWVVLSTLKDWDETILGFILVPVIMFVKAIFVALGGIGLLALNSYFFTNAFKND